MHSPVEESSLVPLSGWLYLSESHSWEYSPWILVSLVWESQDRERGGRPCMEEPNTDYPGHDLETLGALESLQLCVQACQDRVWSRLCRGVTFTAVQTCRLKWAMRDKVGSWCESPADRSLPAGGLQCQLPLP